MRVLTLGLVLLLPIGLMGAGRSQRTRGPHPSHTLSTLKRAVKAGNRILEWSTLSPEFKDRISSEAGRVITVADYTAFRNAQRRDRDVRKLESALRSARVTRVRMVSRRAADVTIRFGGPLVFGTSTKVRMVLKTLWRLEIKGERQAYWGYVGDRRFAYTKHEDGSYTVVGRDLAGLETFRETFPAERVNAFRTFSKWYFHHFGAAESHFLNVR